MIYYHYTVELYNAKTKVWTLGNRYYKVKLDLTDNSICDVLNKRRNAQYIGVVDESIFNPTKTDYIIEDEF